MSANYLVSLANLMTKITYKSTNIDLIEVKLKEKISNCDKIQTYSKISLIL